ncbi:MAG: 2-aminoethylphosphonate--pyruvate transaminase [Gammaproteobacteria bacterium]|nr:2-aminoethylphosphonate--pyruvate transaminase [Gammaproteobacteria bacterium]
MIKVAVILAAGFGSRLKDKTKTMPKGFLPIEGISLIERSVNNLLKAGIEKIFIGTGYLAEHYQTFAQKFPEIICINNSDFSNTGSMETLFVMRKYLNEDFLLLESDLLYESDAIKHLIHSSDTILASGTTHSNDEVYIQAAGDNTLQKMSKEAKQLTHISAELVGITSISQASYHAMCEVYAAQDNKKIDYEYILVAVNNAHHPAPFKIKKIDSLAWCEIDDAQHLARALKLVLPKIKAANIQIKRNILLNPGPATTTDSVKLAQVVPDICPREQEFGELMEFVSVELTSIVANPETYTSVLFGGSGTAAVESVLTSVVPHDKAVLIINNGAYGQRMCEIASRYKMNFVEFNSSPVEPVDLARLEEIIQQNTQFSHLALIHNETTTGLLNDIEGIGKLAAKYQLDVILDAMSSYAALPIDMQEQNITYLVASSNKNIQGMAGICFIVASKIKFDSLKDIEPRTFYLSLHEQYSSFIKTRQMRFTPPVQTLYALKQAVIEAKKEGIAQRYQRYSESWELLTSELKQMGLTYLVDDAHHSKIITSINLPEELDFNKMHDHFYSLGYTIYPGKVEEFNTFRIANIGQVDKNDIQHFVCLLREYIEKALRGDNDKV